MMTWITDELLFLARPFLNQFVLLFPYWMVGLVLSAFLTAYAEKSIEKAASALVNRQASWIYLLPACLLGVISPLCMYGTVPLIATLARRGLPQYLLVGFMVSSILLNPTLFVMSLSLGVNIALLRLFSALLCGILAGLLVSFIWKDKPIFQLNVFIRDEKGKERTRFRQFLHSLRRNFEISAPYLLLGMTLTVLFQRYIPTNLFTAVLGKESPFAILVSASIGVPLYMCGGGTIPIIQSWLESGMSTGAAAAFMLSGPATKLNNLSAVKMILGSMNFLLYIIYTLLFSLCIGYVANLIF